MSSVVNDENISQVLGAKVEVGTTKSARRNGLYMTSKEVREFNLGRNKFGAQLSLNDIVHNGSLKESVKIHEDDEYNRPIEEDLIEENDLTATASINSASTINKRSSIPYVDNRFSSSSYNGSSFRNSKRFSTKFNSSSDSDEDMEVDDDDEDFNRCFFNNPNGRRNNLTSISIRSSSSAESIGFTESAGGKPGLVGFEPVKPIKPVRNLKSSNIKRRSQISNGEKRFSQISGNSDKRFSQISSASSDRSSKRMSVLGLLRQQTDHSQSSQHLKPAHILPYIARPEATQQLQQQRQSVAQPSSSRIHRLMHSVSIRSGLFKLKDPQQPEEKKVQMKRSFFSIRSGLNRSASTMDIHNIDRNSISLPVPQDQTLKKIDNKLKNSSSIYSLVSRR